MRGCTYDALGVLAGIILVPTIFALMSLDRSMCAADPVHCQADDLLLAHNWPLYLSALLALAYGLFLVVKARRLQQ